MKADKRALDLAGKMVLCEKFYDPVFHKVMVGLDLMSGICHIPHHNSIGLPWVENLIHLLPDFYFQRIEEEASLSMMLLMVAGWCVEVEK